MALEKSFKARLTTAAILLLVLAAGVVSGVALDRRLESNASSERVDRRSGLDGRSRGFDPRSRDPRSGRESSERRPPMIVDQVGLSAEQKAKVDSIVGYFRDQMRALNDEFDEAYMTRFRELNRTARTEIRAVLTEEQNLVYDSLQGEWERRREERRQDSISDEGGQRD